MTKSDALPFHQETVFADAFDQFEELLTQTQPVFLLGAGCSKCAGKPLTTELTQRAMGSAKLDDSTRAILTEVEAQFAGAASAHIEDYLSELIDWLAIVDRRSTRQATQQTVCLGGAEYTSKQLRVAVDQIKNAIATIIDEPCSLDTHRAFVRTLHRPSRPGRTTPGRSVDYLVLNYDTVLENALAIERIPYSDGLDGGATGWWNPETFEREGLAARVLKLHGSVDWCEVPGDHLPRRVGPGIALDGARERRILIWPASTKYVETQLDPYAQLMTRARTLLRPRAGSQRVLVICGYSFGDSHINMEIDRALRETSGNLTIVVFTTQLTPCGPLKVWHEDAFTRERVLIFAKKGFFHGKRVKETCQELPWCRFESITRMLGGDR